MNKSYLNDSNKRILAEEMQTSCPSSALLLWIFKGNADISLFSKDGYW